MFVERISLLREDKRTCSTALCAMCTGLASFGRTHRPAPKPGPGELLQKALLTQALLQAGHLPDAVQHCLPRKTAPTDQVQT